MQRGGKSIQLILMISVAVLTGAPQLLGQQTYVTRYDAFVGYTFLDSPALGLFENGVHGQVGFRPTTWYSVGFDYSHSLGDLTVTPGLLTDALQQQLAAQIAALVKAGVIPPTYSLSVPAHSITDEFALGPQLAYRHFRKITLFMRPSIGAVRENVTPKPRPGDVVAAAIVKQLVPAGSETDWQGFYGFGYGIDFLFTNHFALRVQGDLVWEHLFQDLLKNGRWTTRFSVGPCFNFGRNIVRNVP